MLRLREHFAIANVIVSHNLATDLKMINVDAARLGINFIIEDDKHLFCTMMNGMDFAQHTLHRGEKKYPKLEEVYEALWGDFFARSEKHNSAEDMDYCARVYCGMWLVDSGINPAELYDTRNVSHAMLRILD